MVLAFTKLSFNFCHSKNIRDNDERYKKLKENCRPIKLTRSISLATIRPAGEHLIRMDWDWMESWYTYSAKCPCG